MLKALLQAGVILPGQTVFIPVKEKMGNYNGFTNYQTYSVYTWIANTEDLYFYTRKQKFDADDLAYWFISRHKQSPIIMKDFEPLSMVNWAEVAESINKE